MWWNGLCNMWNNGAWGAWGWIGMALNLLLWAALIGAAVYLISRAIRQAGGTGPSAALNAPATAIRIAQERYARGEIDREQYLKLVEDLQ